MNECSGSWNTFIGFETKFNDGKHLVNNEQCKDETEVYQLV